ncbi:MAG TPA: glycine--tRNA ligase [Polyangiaceae bacterium]|nr:glycine--tRNA ligase [Polyangiaceae bacterium]
MSDATVMDKIVSLCKRRGFIYPASEIYGGINGFWDYGPLGVLLKNNIRDSWWRAMVECPPIGPDGHPIEMVGLDSAIIQHPKTWVASGHVGGFADPMSTCRQCKRLFRSDHVADMLRDAEWVKSLLSALGKSGLDGLVEFHEDFLESDPTTQALQRWARKEGKKLAPGLALVRQWTATLDGMRKTVREAQGGAPHGQPVATNTVEFLLRAMARPSLAEPLLDPCPNCGGDLTPPRQFNLMFESHAGAVQDDSSKVYLRPETAQGIFLNYKNVLDTTRVKVPFGVAQIGKSFRNEVTPRNFVFRSREFEQMEMEWFCHPDEAKTWFEFWKTERMRWWRSLGVSSDNLRFRDHDADELSHYSKMTVDIEYRYPFTAPDYGELEGIAHRGSFDLTQHQQHSGQKLEYFDQELQLKLKAAGAPDDEIKAKSRYIPNVIEPASGLTRAVLLLLCEGYAEDASRASPTYLRFDPKVAPVKLGIFPLVNKDGLPEIAEKLYMDLRTRFACEFDAKQSIGKRYARMDEIGTPFCVTIDGQTLEDQTVTLRDRDTAAQERVALDQVAARISPRLTA